RMCLAREPVNLHALDLTVLSLDPSAGEPLDCEIDKDGKIVVVVAARTERGAISDIEVAALAVDRDALEGERGWRNAASRVFRQERCVERGSSLDGQVLDHKVLVVAES